MQLNTLPDQFNILSLFEQEIQEGVLVLLGAMPKEPTSFQSPPEQWVRLFLPGLCERVLHVSEWVLLAHYMVAEDDLEGETASEKFDAFARLLQEPDVLTFFRERYALLFKSVRQEVRNWTGFVLSLHTRLSEDWDDLCQTFPELIDSGQLQEVRPGMGDCHNGGETVTLLTFRTGFRLFYKPGNRKAEQEFARFCDWADEYLQVGFRFPAALFRDTHSWSEFIDQQDCSNEAELHAFYERTGVFLAFFHVLQASDFHYENLIAAGGFPVPVDLEVLFQPMLPASGHLNSRVIVQTVLSTGLLPRTIHRTDEGRTDVSGLSNVDGNPGILEQMVFDFDVKGHLTRSRERGRLTAGRNRPTLAGKVAARNASHEQDLLRGFTRAYDFLMDQAQAVMEKLEGFRTLPTRILFRNTYAYSHLLKESRHPELLASATATEQHWNWLDVAVQETPMVLSFLEAEKADLRNRDIPFFFSFPGKKHLYHHDTELCRDFFDRSGWDVVMDKLFSLCPDDKDKQAWIIATSLELERCQGGQERHQGGQERHPGFQGSNPLLQTQNQLQEDQPFGFLGRKAPLTTQELATSIAQNLARELIQKMDISEDEAHWLVLKPVDLEGNCLELLPASYDLFGGMPGEILLMAYLGAWKKDAELETISNKAMHSLVRNVEAERDRIHDLGFFVGWGGLIYTLVRLGVLHKNEERFREAHRWLEQLPLEHLLQEERIHGLIYGSCGFVLACLSLYSQTGDLLALESAKKAGDHLIRSAWREGDAMAWRGNSSQPLAGLAHGASGFALCFARLWKHTHEEAYLEAARATLRYESRLYNPIAGNWTDLRDFVTERNREPVYTTAWSHGAPGIGLVRLELLEMDFPQPEIRTDLDRAIQNNLQYGFGPDHSLCFGGFGHLELLLNASRASRVLENANPYSEELQNLTERYARSMMETGLIDGFLLNGGRLKTAGLMSGLTGIAWQCLRIADPDFFPSLLTMAE